MFDASSLLGSMLSGGFGRRRARSSSGSSVLGTVATVGGLAAVGGLGYMAYRHFTAQPGAQPAPGWGGPPAGAQPAPGWGGPPAGAPPAPGWGTGPAAPGATGAAAAGGGIGGYLKGLVGTTGGLQTGAFGAGMPGYEHQSGAAAAPAPPAAWPAPPGGAAPGWSPPAATPPTPGPAATVAASAAPAVAAPTDAEQAAAMLLVRAMVAAANADGTIDDGERAEILARLEATGLGPEERAALALELDRPRPVAALAAEVTDPALAKQFYAVSCLAIDVDNTAERLHLQALPGMLKLSREDVAAIHADLGVPVP